MPRTNGGTIGSVNIPQYWQAQGIWTSFDAYVSRLRGQWPAAIGNISIMTAHGGTPFITGYPWTSVTGFGTKYSNPTTLLPTNGYTTSFNPTGTTVGAVVTGSTSNGIHAWAWNSSGFGTKYSAPATNFDSSVGIAWNPNGDVVGTAPLTTPFIIVYPWSASTGFGTKYSDPASLPGQHGNNTGAIKWTPAGSDVGRAGPSSGTVAIYPWSTSTGFGTRYSNPSTPAGGATTSLDWSPAGNALVVGSYGSPYVDAYQFATGVGYGTKYSNPSNSVYSWSYGVAFSPSGNDIAFVNFHGSPYITVYAWTYSSGFGTKYSNPVSPPAVVNGPYSLTWTPDGKDLILGLDTTPYICVYPFTSGTGYGTKYSNPSILPTGTVTGVASTAVST